MKTISLYTNNGSWLTQLHPFTKLWYLAAAICIPLLTGSLWGFAVMIIISFALLKSGRLIKKALPLIAFSFTIILTIFLIHGLVNQQNKNVLFAIGFLRFYKEGLFCVSDYSADDGDDAYHHRCPEKPRYGNRR